MQWNKSDYKQQKFSIICSWNADKEKNVFKYAWLDAKFLFTP